MTFEGIILLGPESELSPLVNERLRKLELPILNQPLISHNLKLLSPICSKIFIVGLREQIDTARRFEFLAPIEFVVQTSYDGTVSTLLKIKHKLAASNVIVIKGDLITDMCITNIATHFLAKSSIFLTILTKSQDKNICIGYLNDDLLFYSDSESPDIEYSMFKNAHNFTLTRELDTAQFYMFKKEIFSMFSPEFFSFKHNLLPFIINTLKNTQPVTLLYEKSSYVFQVKNVENFLEVNKVLKSKTVTGNIGYNHKFAKIIKKYVKKNSLNDYKNFIGSELNLNEVLVFNSIIGEMCEIKRNSKIISCILMDNVKIESDCIIEKSTIGKGVSIPRGTELCGCIVAPGYVFDKALQVKNEIFLARAL